MQSNAAGSSVSIRLLNFLPSHARRLPPRAMVLVVEGGVPHRDERMADRDLVRGEVELNCSDSLEQHMFLIGDTEKHWGKGRRAGGISAEGRRTIPDGERQSAACPALKNAVFGAASAASKPLQGDRPGAEGAFGRSES
jgi:hypothetical protein